MAVIINDLEVVVGSEEPPAPEPERPAGEAPLRPEDINAVLERQRRLVTRVLAH